jgi:HPr kinase/phosphorylase
MLLRLLDHGFALVADDRVILEDGLARAGPGLAGLLEIRGIGILRLPFVDAVPVRLAVRLTSECPARLPWPARLDAANVPLLDLDPRLISAATRVRMAMDCVLGRVGQLAGFAAVGC